MKNERLTTEQMKEIMRSPFSIKEAENILNSVVELENENHLSSEIIEGSKMPLRILKNNFKKENPTVFLTHGSGMNEYDWAPVLYPLEQNEINAATFSWRGHSPYLEFNAEKFKGTGLMDYINDASCALENIRKNHELDENEIVLIGHSYGTIINTYLARNRKFSKIINFCAGYPNQETLAEEGINTSNKKELMKKMSSLWGFSSEEYVESTLKEAAEMKYFRNYREAEKLKWHLENLFNLDIPEGYPEPGDIRSLEFLLGPSSRKAVADGLITPPFLPKKSEIKSPMNFVAATHDKMVSPKTVEYFARIWEGSYTEIEGPHVLTYSPALEKVIKFITDKIYKN